MMKLTPTFIKSILSAVLGLLVSWACRDPLTMAVFQGKTFSGRSLLPQILIVIGLGAVIGVVIYNILNYLIPGNLISWTRKIRNPKIESSSDDQAVLPAGSSEKLDGVELQGALALTFYSVTILFLLEWVFFITKESFMDPLGMNEKIAIVLQTIWIGFLVSGILLFIFWILARLTKSQILIRVGKVVFLLVPSVVLSITAMLLLDNFTYIILGYGIVNTIGVYRILYGLGFLLFIYSTYTRLKTIWPRFRPIILSRGAMAFTWILIGIATVTTVIGVLNQGKTVGFQKTGSAGKTPNILLIGADGLDASHLPFAGYERDTTPFLSSIEDELLISENNFSNAGSSAGSVITILTSKPAYSTNVVNIPDALRGDDSYEHLPGILNDLGYFNEEITYMRYVDAYLVNVRNGFDRVNGRNLNPNFVSQIVSKFYPVESQYFLDVVLERISDRLYQILLIKKMPNPFKEIYAPNSARDYEKRIPEVLDTIQAGNQPFFIHTHLLCTHGPFYQPQVQVFSKGKVQKEKREADFYDDAILEFDQYFKTIYDSLESRGILENTILVIYSDHPQSRDTKTKIPLIFRFPNAEHAGRIRENTQNMDIAPTVLDYMSISIPTWMDGKSLINGDIAANRFIPSVIWRRPNAEKQNKRVFRQFGSFRLISCQRFVEFSATSKEWTHGEIDDYTSPCPVDTLPAVSDMKAFLIDQLEQNGFITTSMDSIGN